MWLIYLHWIYGDKIEPCAIAKNEADAKEYIKSKTLEKQYSGLGIYKIMKLPLI